MTDIREILKHLPSAAKAAADKATETRELMDNAVYMRQSLFIMRAAVDEGMDVLQLANGDIITSGMQPIEIRYGWDEAKGKIVKKNVKVPPAIVVPREETIPQEEDVAN